MTLPIYLDYNATTPIDPRVKAAMDPYLSTWFGNPSSGHAYGAEAANAVATARRDVAALIGADPGEVIFTGGGSEADNLAITGLALASGKHHLITQATEHPAVLKTVEYLCRRLGFSATILPVDGNGLVDPQVVAQAISPDTALVTIMHANNETGVLQPIAEIGRICRERGVPFHTDAAQSVGKAPVDVNALQVDLLTIAGHKLYAPKGIGALYIRRGTAIDSIIHGASQEFGRRAGTENVAGIAGLGAAAALAADMLNSEIERLATLRDSLYQRLADGAPLRLNGHPTRRLPNTLNVCILDHDGEDILARTPGVAASTGSACHSGETEPSAVLLAMGIPAKTAIGALRLTVGRYTTSDDIDRAAGLLLTTIRGC